MKTVAVLILIGVISIAIFGITAGQTAVNRYYDDQAAPGSVVDAIMRSRQTPPVAPEPPNRTAAVLFPLAMLALVGIAVGLLFYGERFMRQWRLMTKKKGRPQAAAPLPYYQNPQQLPEWQQAPTVRQIPAPREHENGHGPY